GMFRSQTPLALPPPHELPDLTADGRHHLQQVIIRLPDLVAKEPQDTQRLPSQPDGATKSAVQSLRGGNGRTRGLGILRDIGHPGGPAAAPDAPPPAPAPP